MDPPEDDEEGAQDQHVEHGIAASLLQMRHYLWCVETSDMSRLNTRAGCFVTHDSFQNVVKQVVCALCQRAVVSADKKGCQTGCVGCVNARSLARTKKGQEG